MKFVHKVHHLEDAIEREPYASAINKYLNNYSTELYSPTIKISNQDEFMFYIKENQDFNLNLKGYNLDEIQGWRYGEVGLWISNFLAWKEFYNSDADCGIFMEDDIMFDETFMDVLKEYMSELPENWDAFFFAVPPGQFHKYDVGNMDIGANNICKVYQDHWMLCYVLSKRGVKIALDNTSSGVNLPLDWYFFRQRHIFNSYAVKPTSKFVCWGSPTDTTFQNQERKVLKIDS